MDLASEVKTLSASVQKTLHDIAAKAGGTIKAGKGFVLSPWVYFVAHKESLLIMFALGLVAGGLTVWLA